MGNNKLALALLIEKVGDVKEAIDFVQSKNDDELWEDLIAHSMTNANFVSGLLENIGGHVDPIKLIRRIPNGMTIPHLRDRLVKIISDYNLQMSLREGCNRILKSDCVDLTQRLNRAHRKGLRADAPQRCQTCQSPIVCSKNNDDSLVAFFCSHSYHLVCLRTAIQHQKTAGAAPGGPTPPITRAAAAGAGQSTTQQFWCIICNSQAMQNASS